MNREGNESDARPDACIWEDVRGALTDEALDAPQVEVGVEHGEVTLTGTVDDDTTRRRIEALVERVPGVRAVHCHVLMRWQWQEPARSA